jgi:hypothetical protein
MTLNAQAPQAQTPTPAPQEPAQKVLDTQTGAVTDPAQKEAPAKVEEPKRESASQLIQALAKEKKAALQAKREAQSIKSQMEAMQKQLEELQGKYTQSSAKPGSPIEALMRHGYSYEDAVQFQLNGGKITPDMEIKEVRAEIQRMREEQESKEKQAKETAAQAAQREYEQAKSQYIDQAKDFIAEKADAYELISLNMAPEEAAAILYDTVEAHFNKTKKVLTIEEAAGLLESHLEEQAEKIARAKKIQAKLAPKAESAEPQQGKEAPKTLSNAATVSSSAPSLLPAKTEQDRLRRAMEKLGG